MRNFLFLVTVVTLVACQPEAENAAVESAAEQGASDALAAVFDAQPDEVKARYQYRHPQETLEFFGIEPGMTVVEGLPGRGGWYTKILVPYLGRDGHLIGADYSLEMYPYFSFATEEFMAKQVQFVNTFPENAAALAGDSGASASAFHFGSMPESMTGTADVVFFARVLHNLARHQDEGRGNYLDQALADAYAALKPGGIFGVVQHHARDDMPDDWANGANGYLKRQFIIDQVEAAGFEFVAESDMHANPKDQPTTDDFVWRLPPNLVTSRDDPELRAELEAVGETNRIALKFRKPE